MKETHSQGLNKAIDYIQTNLDQDLSLRQLAKIALISKFHFGRIFKKAMGETLYHYIKRLRLEHAAVLL